MFAGWVGEHFSMQGGGRILIHLLFFWVANKLLLQLRLFFSCHCCNSCCGGIILVIYASKYLSCYRGICTSKVLSSAADDSCCHLCSSTSEVVVPPQESFTRTLSIPYLNAYETCAAIHNQEHSFQPSWVIAFVTMIIYAAQCLRGHIFIPTPQCYICYASGIKLVLGARHLLPPFLHTVVVYGILAGCMHRSAQDPSPLYTINNCVHLNCMVLLCKRIPLHKQSHTSCLHGAGTQ